MDLSFEEKRFLVACVIMAAFEGFYYGTFDVSNEDIERLMFRLGASEYDIDIFRQA